MAIPPDILAVERPKNTVVYTYGNGKYGVKKRIGCVRKNGKNYPVNGPTCGHIVNYEYVPIPDEPIERVSQSALVDLKDWANYYLCNKILSDVIAELRVVYHEKDVQTILCIAILRVCEPGIKDYELKCAYEESFLSEYYPGVALSKNSVSSFLNDVGRNCSKITNFMRLRTASVNIDHHILIDGTLKSDESSVNTLSDFSRKARTKGTRDISVWFAFDLEKHEPICSKCYPGNMIDATSYGNFISENNLTQGIIVADKGFPSSSAGNWFSEHKDLHYLNPLKRNSKYIKLYQLRTFQGVLKNNNDVQFSKVYCPKCNRHLYFFRNRNQAAIEEKDWLRHHNGETKAYDDSAYKDKMLEFGTILLESDLDMTPEMAYKTFETRWEIEIVMRFYKSACKFDETREHDDYSVIASEFCDFISTVLTFKLLNLFDKIKILEKMTYKECMKILKKAKKVKATNDDWTLIRLNPSHKEILEQLEIVPKSLETENHPVASG